LIIAAGAAAIPAQAQMNNEYTAQGGAWHLYRKNCSGCHGFQGQGIPPVAPPLMGNQFLTTSAASAVKATIRNGRKDKTKAYPPVSMGAGYMNMPAFGNNIISDRELDDLVTYLRGPFQQRSFNQ
jgi:mono/diheme cytochrome c family protein